MKLRTHTCKASGCQREISARMLMCLDHWRMVPAPLRRQIATAAKSMARDWESAINLGAEYRGAVAQAVAAVAEKQGSKAAASAGPSGNLFT